MQKYKSIQRTIYRLFLLAGGGIGLWIKTGLFSGEVKWYSLLYYTNWSNFLVILLFSFLVVFPECNGVKGFLRIKGGATMMIGLTGIVYHFLLRETGFLAGGIKTTEDLGSFLLHYYVPLLTWMDWLIWDEKGIFTKRDPIFWAVVPYVYTAFILWVATKGNFFPNQISRYPYPFLEIDTQGWEAVFVNVLLLSVGYIGLGYFYFGGDRFLYQRKHKTIKQKRYAPKKG